mgnify:FL=1
MKDIKVLKATPMFNGVITTCHQWEVDGESDGLIDTAKSQGVVKPHQTVVAVGSAARSVKVGDLVIIDPTRFAVKRYNDGSLKDNVATNWLCGLTKKFFSKSVHGTWIMYSENVSST